MYVKQSYPAKIIESLFIDNIFESIAVEIEIPKIKRFIAISLYRPNCHKQLSKVAQLEQFMVHFNNLLTKLASRTSQYIFFLIRTSTFLNMATISLQASI